MAEQRKKAKRTAAQEAPLPLGSAAAASRPTPTDRLVEATNRLIDAKADHITTLDRERLERLAELERLRGEAARLQAVVDTLRPELATARAELVGLRVNNSVASLFTLVGGAGVSAVGYCGSFTTPVLWAGTAILFCGLVILATGSRGRRRE